MVSSFYNYRLSPTTPCDKLKPSRSASGNSTAPFDSAQDDHLSVKNFERKQLKGLDLYPEVEETCTSTQFSHIFQGGYSSGYYSYKWAEVLDADAFEAFKEAGVFNEATAERFKKHILSAGGSEHPSILYKRFRGKEATVDALLKRSGLLSDN